MSNKKQQITQTQIKNIFLRHIATAFFWILLVLLSLELILRILFRNPVSHFSYDDKWGLHPAAGTTVVWGTEGYGVTHYINDGEVSTPYGGGKNIVVLGDSHTAALQVNDNYKFVSVAEQTLRDKGYDVDLRNLGEDSYSVADYVYLSPIILNRYDPEIVVIQLSVQDFWADDGFNPIHMNYFIAAPDGLLQVNHQPSSKNQGLLRLKNSLALLDFGYFRFQQISTLFNQQRVAASTQPNTNSYRREEKAHLQFEALQKAYANARLIIVLLPYVPKIDGGNLLIRDDFYNFLVKEVNAVSEWYLVDPLDAFIQIGNQGQLPRGFSNTLPGEGHLNVYGHRIVGTLLAEKLEEVLQ